MQIEFTEYIKLHFSSINHPSIALNARKQDHLQIYCFSQFMAATNHRFSRAPIKIRHHPGCRFSPQLMKIITAIFLAGHNFYPQCEDWIVTECGGKRSAKGSILFYQSLVITLLGSLNALAHGLMGRVVKYFFRNLYQKTNMIKITNITKLTNWSKLST